MTVSIEPVYGADAVEYIGVDIHGEYRTTISQQEAREYAAMLVAAADAKPMVNLTLTLTPELAEDLADFCCFVAGSASGLRGVFSDKHSSILEQLRREGYVLRDVPPRRSLWDNPKNEQFGVNVGSTRSRRT